MQITKTWLSKNNACQEACDWIVTQEDKGAASLIRAAVSSNHFAWANWGIVRLMNRKQKMAHAIFAAEQVLDIFEKKYPEDKRPRKAIDAARKCLEADTASNRKAAYAAAAAAYAAAAYAAKRKMQIKILEYGITLINETEVKSK